ncbi:MAG: type II secretion system ATPase GspE [Candidatus Theseobacter exili]|nr:type II secretion system ATPase GspE [Candidatus Theseobacter exili]
MNEKDQYILEILQEHEVITKDQAEEAARQADEMEKPVVDKLISLGYIDRKRYVNVIASHFGMRVVDLSQINISKEMIDMIPSKTARRNKAIPIEKVDGRIIVGISDPFDVEAVDNLSFILKSSVEAVLVSEEDINNALDQLYGVTEETVDTMLHEISESDLTFIDGGANIQEMSDEDQDAPIVKLVSLLLLEAFRNRASDVHLEPMEKRFRVRYRIDGVLHEVQGPPKRLQPSVISRIKIMSNMSIAEKRLPQDGRIKLKMMGKDIDLRVSTLPASHGESVVLRLLDKSNILLGLPQLGFMTDDQKKYEQLIQMPNGILLITGPTGSGKTTTLYACLNFINRPDRKIITVEDPVEYQLPGINQVQVNEEINLNFANILRSILRQAPNVIMIGEIRDYETAEIAVNASLTGHLVFSTLHTNDAPGAITRLVDQGIKPFLVASSVQGILAQRLVRRICDKCKEPHKASDKEFDLLGQAAHELKKVTIYKGKGCDECSGTGYRGRIGIMELMVVDDTIRNLIYKKASSTEIRSRARETGMRTLREDGLRKVAAGVTTLAEVFRVTQGDIN